MGRQFSRCARRRAFTLVEMLIAMVLTLILVTAIAQFYAIVGDSVKDGRAMIEMGSQMRAATQRLKADLDLITVSVVPWTDDGSASGYFEYFEGIANDYNANGNAAVDAIEDTDSNGTPDLQQLGVTNMLGDGDDFIAFTIRSSGQPFSGRYTYPINGNPVIYTSQLAEVVWWVAFEDISPDTVTAPNNLWDFSEPRQLYRRQLLIRPDLWNIIDSNTPYLDRMAAQQQMWRIWQQNDISLSVRAEFTAAVNEYRYYVRPNSLADLSKRENRFAHLSFQLDATTLPALWDVNFPHRQLLVPSVSAKSPGLKVGAANPQFSFVLQGQSLLQPGANDFPGESPGEDIVLSNLLAFDVQLYDPYARIWPDNPANLASSTAALVPSDPGYLAAATAAQTIVNNGNPPPLLGLGAYVDLGYYRYVNTLPLDSALTALGYPLPYFANLPEIPPALLLFTPPQIIAARDLYSSSDYLGCTYDTWALSNERDGIFQLARFRSPPFSLPVQPTRMDMQVNGLDDDGANGVDDARERETVPPYSQPLRGLQVKIRLYEPSTRQVRQATVGTDFITE